MRKIVITEKNYKMVFGMLKKFFAHKNFLYWHNYNQHGKKRLSSILKIENPFGSRGIEKHDTKIFKNVITVESDFDVNTKTMPYLSVISNPIELGNDNITIGDEIYFCSNRIVIKQKFNYYNLNYLYECYQILSDNDNIEDLPIYDSINYEVIDANTIKQIFEENE